MTTEEDIKDDAKPTDDSASAPTATAEADDEGSSNGSLGHETGREASLARRDASGDEGNSESGDEDDEDLGTPAQLGGQRFVYAAYFAGGIAIAFLLSKAITYSWTRLSLWKPQVGDPHDEIVMPLAALIGALVAFYYYRDEKTRTLAEEVASELGQVSWPSRDEVVNGTFVVIVTTFVATAFFALMDRFWGFMTNLVYGA